MYSDPNSLPNPPSTKIRIKLSSPDVKQRKKKSDPYQNYIYRPPVPLTPVREIRKKLCEIITIEELEQLAEKPEDPEKEFQKDEKDKNKKICPTCHHYKETIGKNKGHRCPIKEDGTVKPCPGWEYCPTGYRKGHDEVDRAPQTLSRIKERIEQIKKTTIERFKINKEIPVNPHYEDFFQTLKKNNIARSDPTLQAKVIKGLKEFVIAKKNEISPEGTQTLQQGNELVEKISVAEKFGILEQTNQQISTKDPLNFDVAKCTDEVS
jgi:hypothetical protein